MPITINGSGTLTGISAGGLPDGVVQPADLSTGAPSWTSGGDLSFNSGYGSAATAYGCRAWVNFNGTGTVAIRASGNVSSITDNGTGDYTVNFTTAMADANYCSTTCSDSTGISQIGSVATESKTTSSIRLSCAVVVGVPGSSAMTFFDLENVNVAIFR